MQGKLLRVLICITVVSMVLVSTMIVRHISDNTNTKEVPIIETGINEESPLCTIITETTQTTIDTMTTDTAVPESSAMGYVQEEEPVKNTEIEQKYDTQESRPASEYMVCQDDVDEFCDKLYSPSEFMVLGAIRWKGWLWTYYSERILPGDGLDIPGRHNDSNGYVCDENGYICLSSSTLPYGTVLKTPLGKYGRVYDTGCASHIIDVYVNW